MDDIFQDDVEGHKEDLAAWVSAKVQEYRDHYQSNYAEKHDEYMRIYRNQWAKQDSSRDTERSRLIAPATSQAVESNVAEVEEATFGRGKLFDIRDAVEQQDNPQALANINYLKNKLHDDFALGRIRSSVAEVLVNAAVFGTGMAEIVLDEIKELKPSERPTMDGAMTEYGVEETYRPLVKLNPVMPKNFLIDPYATNVDDALGVAVDEFVSRHVVEELQEQGVYLDVYVGNSVTDTEIQIDPMESQEGDKIRLTKWYGKVPRELLLEHADEEDIEEESHYIESVVVLANEETILKAMPSPYMCKDRPIVAFQWDIVPSQFHGRGVCEKAYMSQKALDAELRARIDALALTTHPMMAVDASRMPRDKKLEVRPGRMLLTNGNPSEVLQPLTFGNLNAITFQQGAQLQQMVSQATGSADQSMAQVQNDVTAAGMSMSQGALIKRQKRTLVNFQENFLIPFIRKTAYRYMQYDPENYPAVDYTFVPFSSLGAMAREYEVAQLSQILQVIPPESPAHAAIVKGIVDHLNVSNREELITAIESGQQGPSPEQQQMEQQQQQAQMGLIQGQIDLLTAQSMEAGSRAQKNHVETQLMPQEMTMKYSDIDGDGAADDKEFERKIRLSEMLLKEQELQLKQDIELEGAKGKAEAELIKSLEQGLSNGATNNAGPSQAAPAAAQ